MSIELVARIITAERLIDVLGHAERYISAVPHSSFVTGANHHGADIIVGPFPVPESPGLIDKARMYKDAFSMWERGHVVISVEHIARIGLAVGYRARLDEMELGSYEPTDADQRENDATAGYCALVNAGFLRTKASFCLASLVICAVAERNQSCILDDAGNVLKLGRFVNPSSLAQIFARHGGAKSFAAFAGAFCADVGFAPNWA